MARHQGHKTGRRTWCIPRGERGGASAFLGGQDAGKYVGMYLEGTSKERRPLRSRRVFPSTVPIRILLMVLRGIVARAVFG